MMTAFPRHSLLCPPAWSRADLSAIRIIYYITPGSTRVPQMIKWLPNFKMTVKLKMQKRAILWGCICLMPIAYTVYEIIIDVSHIRGL